jgi:hypothetical protein
VVVTEGGATIKDASTGEAAVIEATFSTEGPVVTFTKTGWNGVRCSGLNFEPNTPLEDAIAIGSHDC